MLFSSITFLYFFLITVLTVYLIAPKKCKNVVLLIASIIFYGWGEPKYVLLMLASILLGYIFGLLIERYRNKSKIFLILSVSTSLAILGLFKYAKLNLALPIGISFYTFQILSYTIDVYREKVKAQKNPIILATYISLFPQLIAGPIVRYQDVEKQLTDRETGFENITKGIERFIIGLSKKVLIANQLGELTDIFNKSNDRSVLFFWLYAIAVTLQIYYDFSGYSDMAIGLGRMFGFKFNENFNYPYVSKSITEFWRRWHMSLGGWFRDYVYIPLGGNRVSKIKWFRNIFIVWTLTGLWHGASWNFVLWGLMFAILLIIEKAFLKNILAKVKVVNHIYVLLMVMISFVIFDAGSLDIAFTNIAAMFGVGGYGLYSYEALYYFRSYLVVIIVAIIFSAPVAGKIYETVSRNMSLKKIANFLEIVIVPLLLLLITAFLVDGSFNPFLYFRF